MTDWIIDRLPRVAVVFALILWLLRVVGLFLVPDVANEIIELVVVWILYPVCAIWCFLSIRRSRSTGSIVLVPGVLTSSVLRSSNNAAFNLGVAAYWLAFGFAIFMFVVSVVGYFQK